MTPARRSSSRGQVLIILIGVLFLGGGGLMAGLFAYGASIKELKSRVKHVVVDEARARAAMEQLAAYEKQMDRVQKHASGAQKEVLALFKRQDARSEEFAAAFARVDAATAGVDVEFLAVRHELKTHLRPEEWAKIFGPQSP